MVEHGWEIANGIRFGIECWVELDMVVRAFLSTLKKSFGGE
jgi:hypothetical protein